MQTFWLFVVALAIGALQAFIYRIVTRKAITYHRAFTQSGAFCGEHVEMVEVLENRSPLPIPFVRAESRISPHVRLGANTTQTEQDSRMVSGDMYHRSLFFLRSFSRVTRRHPVALMHRGYFDAGSVTLTSGDLLGMMANVISLDTGAKIAVYPAPCELGEIPLPCRTFVGEMLVRRFIEPDPFFMCGTRDYRLGDEARFVNPRASARTQNLQVNTFDFTADPHLLIAFNVQLSQSQWDNLSPEQQERIEQALQICAALALDTLSAGAGVGFCANCSVAEDMEKEAYLESARESDQAQAFLELLAHLTLKRTRNFYTMLSEINPAPGTDILILTPYTSRKIEEAAQKLRESGRRVLIHVLEGIAPPQNDNGGDEDDYESFLP